MLVVPSLVYREARFEGGSVRWDGVRRRISRRGSAQAPDTDWAFAGTITGVSLHLLVFDAQGSELGQGWGGLDLAHEFALDGTRDTLVPLAQPLSNPKFVREGTERALDAILGRP